MDKVMKHKKICENLNDTYEKKNTDYGDSVSQTYKEYGLESFAIRLTDKLNRFKTLIDKERNVDDETIEDTLKDLANYSIIAIIEMEE